MFSFGETLIRGFVLVKSKGRIPSLSPLRVLCPVFSLIFLVESIRKVLRFVVKVSQMYLCSWFTPHFSSLLYLICPSSLFYPPNRLIGVFSSLGKYWTDTDLYSHSSFGSVGYRSFPREDGFFSEETKWTLSVLIEGLLKVWHLLFSETTKEV